MEQIFYSITFVIFLFYFFISMAMALENQKFQYKKWLSDKNIFGKCYICIAIIVTIPITMMIYIWNFLFLIGYSFYRLGIKKK
jgi:hypothetical protein